MKRFFLFAVFFLGIFAGAPAARAQVYDTTCPAGSSVSPGGTARNSTNDHLKQNYCTDSTGAPIINGPETIIGPCSGSGCSSGAGTAFNVTSTPYSAVADGTTDNTSALGAVFTASNAVTTGNPTVYFPCQTGKGCQYNFGGAGVSPINPLIPTTIQCDPGVTLHYTGSAHVIDIGVSGLSTWNTSGRFRVTGCRFTDTGSATQVIFFNQWYLYNEIDHCQFYDTPLSASSSAYAIFGNGENFITVAHDNLFIVDNNTAINFLRVIATSDKDSQIIAKNNVVGCALSPTNFNGCTTSGVGIWLSGTASQIEGNEINFMDPQVRVSRFAGSSIITGNNFENNGGADPIIQYGDPGAAGQIDQLIVKDNYANLHLAAGTLIGPANSTDLLTNSSIRDNKIVNVVGTNFLVSLNNASNQVANFADGNACPAIPCLNLHPVTGGGTQNNIQNWITPDHENYSDGFHRANGALTFPWQIAQALTMPSIVSNALTCSSSPCFAQYAYDLPNNQRVGIVFNTVPTGTDNVAAFTREENEVPGGQTGYLCAYVSGTGIEMFVSVAGVNTQLGSTYTATTPAVGNLLEMESIGSVQNCYLQGVPIITAVDSNVTWGYAAVQFAGTTGKISSFVAKGLP